MSLYGVKRLKHMGGVGVGGQNTPKHLMLQ